MYTKEHIVWHNTVTWKSKAIKPPTEWPENGRQRLWFTNTLLSHTLANQKIVLKRVAKESGAQHWNNTQGCWEARLFPRLRDDLQK